MQHASDVADLDLKVAAHQNVRVCHYALLLHGAREPKPGAKRGHFLLRLQGHGLPPPAHDEVPGEGRAGGLQLPGPPLLLVLSGCSLRSTTGGGRLPEAL